MHQSVATIDSPEFLNLQPLDINPLMSKCQIKVLYVGANRNKTFITEEVATEIGKTLRGAPIVGYYKSNKEDFADHGEKIIIDDQGIKFQCQTVPYGFVSPDAKVWFQTFEDKDDFGNLVEHKYLMTTGYLWTEQFPESSLPVKEGRPQSMELQEESVQGRWANDPSSGLDFFIINDAIVQKICILGNDVEPCFEGASVTEPIISKNFTLDDNFKHTLFSMMQDLRNVLNKGEQQMENLEKDAVVTEEVVEEPVSSEFEKIQDKVDEVIASENDIDIEDTAVSSDYAEKKNNDDEDEEEDKSEDEEADSDEEEAEDEKKEDDDDEKSKKYQLLQDELDNLKNSYAELVKEYQLLVDFKNEIDNQKKDALIAEFYMLSDADKKDVIQNKEKYSLEEIKAKLSVICFDKKINFSINEDQDNENQMTYTISEEEQTSLPDWVKAVKEEQQRLG